MPKPKLTPEEKKLLKLEKKAEKKRLAELKKRQLRHDHLSREVKYGQLTVKLHEKNWKMMLTKIALPRLREDLRFAWYNFERVIDSKDFTISLLMDEIANAEEQYMMNLRCHSQNIDSLITRFRDRLDELKVDNDTELACLQASAEKDVQEIRANAAESEEYLKTMLFGLEMARKEQEKLVRGEYLSKIDEETTKYADILQTLRAGLENLYSGIWDTTKSFIKDYTAQTAERSKEYNILARQDDALQKLCADQLLKIHNMKEFIKKLKLRYSNIRDKQGQKISDLQQERQYFADAFVTLRQRLQSDRTIDKENMAMLTVESNQATEYLEKIAKKGKQLLELSAICRKLETVEEKILPFPLPGSTPDAVTTSSDIKLNEYKNTSYLHLFWQRVAQADAIRYSINEEREFLKQENEMLKKKLHEYCECLFCVTDEAAQNCQKKKSRNINVVDGNDVQKKYQQL